jgi:hypothetical protein
MLRLDINPDPLSYSDMIILITSHPYGSLQGQASNPHKRRYDRPVLGSFVIQFSDSIFSPPLRRPMAV